MTYEICAIRDSKAEVFSQPMFFQSRGIAVRAFQDAVNDAKTEFFKHAADYTLFHIGSFDDVRGELVMLSIGPISLGNGATFQTSSPPLSGGN